MPRWLLPVLVLLALAAGLRARATDKFTRAARRARELLRTHGLEAPPPGLEIVVHKAARRLELRAGEVVLLRCRVGLGGAPEGHKLREGDLRTPEGRYYVCTRNPRSRFHLFLGLSYPGPADAAAAEAAGRIDAATRGAIEAAHRRRARPPWKTPLGGEIGIHGFGAGSDWTLGCVALEDADIEALWGLCPLGTPVEILP